MRIFTFSLHGDSMDGGQPKFLITIPSSVRVSAWPQVVQIFNNAPVDPVTLRIQSLFGREFKENEYNIGAGQFPFSFEEQQCLLQLTKATRKGKGILNSQGMMAMILGKLKEAAELELGKRV